MIPESIKKRREEVFSQCRKLLIKINGSVQEKSQASAYLSESSIQTTEDNNQAHNICNCCEKTDIPDEKLTRIESGQRLCPTCLSFFYEVSQKAAKLVY